MTDLPGEAEVFAAASRIAPFIHRTPVLTSASLDKEFGARLFFKCENFQASGAFKARGAFNAVLSLDPASAGRGVATHSSGNHGAALALAAKQSGIPAWIVVPEDASVCKRDAVARYGGRIVSCPPGLANREAALADLVAERDAVVVHPYDDAAVIAGQGTAALELAEQAGTLDLLLMPVGGGGLVSGCALATKAVCPAARIVAAEPAGADDCWQSLHSGRRVRLEQVATIADGLRASIGERNWMLISRLVDEVVRVEEAEIVAAMRLVWERMKIVIEPSAAVPLAAIASGRLAVSGCRVGIILSGGNLDLDALPELFSRRAEAGTEA
jgi:threonine dehydratase